MKIIRGFENLPDEIRGGALTIGNFDGVHLGHARIARRLVALARQLAGPAVVFTFDPHPVRLLRPELAPPPLTWTERKAELLSALGIDWIIAYPTDEALLALGPEEFYDEIVRRRLDAQALVEGPNFFFGKDRRGDVALLTELAERDRIEVVIVEPYILDGQIVSSSRVRTAIQAGEVASAARMLTQPYRIRGMVTHGAGRGNRIGFPTANLHAIDTLLPAEGVYAGRAWLEDRAWPAAINIGGNPTFGEGQLKVEVHLLDFGESIYGVPLEVDFLERVRKTRSFSTVAQLQQQLQADIGQVRRIAAAS